jgi:hypothetical protein
MLATTLTSWLFGNALPIGVVPDDCVPSSPETVPSVQKAAHFYPPNPPLDDNLPLPKGRRERCPSSPDWAALTNISGTSPSKTLYIEEGSEINGRFVFNIYPSLVSSYHSLVNTVYRAFSSIVNTFNNIFCITKYHREGYSTFSTLGGNTALYEGLQPIALEEQFGDDAIYPKLLESTPKIDRSTRKAESWAKFDKIMDAFVSGSFK